MDPLLIALLLVALICPISTRLMTRGKRRQGDQPEQMHPERKRTHPGADRAVTRSVR